MFHKLSEVIQIVFHFMEIAEKNYQKLLTKSIVLEGNTNTNTYLSTFGKLSQHHPQKFAQYPRGEYRRVSNLLEPLESVPDLLKPFLSQLFPTQILPLESLFDELLWLAF